MTLDYSYLKNFVERLAIFIPQQSTSQIKSM